MSSAADQFEGSSGMLETITSTIVGRLQHESTRLRQEFQSSRGVHTRHAVVDNLLGAQTGQEIFAAFPSPDAMRLVATFRERKYTSRSVENFDRVISDALFAFQAPPVLREIEQITGMRDLSGDPHLYAGGISAMVKGNFLNPHIDNSHDSDLKLYRALNLLYYTSPGWRPEWGGNLELWDRDVRARVEIPSLFDRLVIMETNTESWHSVNQVRVMEKRCCVSNYYFTAHPPGGTEHSHVTFFLARPEQRIRRLVSRADGFVRTLVRKVIPRGLAKTDLHRAGQPVKS